MIKVELEMQGLQDLEKRLKALNGKEIECGFLGGEHSQANMPYAALADMLEFGTRANNHGYAIPPRPAFTALINSLQASHLAYELEVDKHYRDFVEGTTTTPHKIISTSGEHITGRHKETMYNWFSSGTQNTTNAQMTIDFKGHGMPFIDTGELIESVSYQETK